MNYASTTCWSVGSKEVKWNLSANINAFTSPIGRLLCRHALWRGVCSKPSFASIIAPYSMRYWTIGRLP